MEEIKLVYSNNNPQYSCSKCFNCSSTFGISLCSIKNRGCCWYFPKFTLYEIHKMVKSKDGLETLKEILKLPKTKVYNYYIHSIGYFDKTGYDNFLKSKKSKEEPYKEHDETMFFRACPFVKSGVGCTIYPQFRSYICNFFICNEVVNKVKKKESKELEQYKKEMDNYVHWIDWENNSIQFMLENKKLDLVHNFNEVINILKELPLENYEFLHLDSIQI